MFARVDDIGSLRLDLEALEQALYGITGVPFSVFSRGDIGSLRGDSDRLRLDTDNLLLDVSRLRRDLDSLRREVECEVGGGFFCSSALHGLFGNTVDARLDNLESRVGTVESFAHFHP